MIRKKLTLSAVLILGGLLLVYLFYPYRTALTFEDPETHQLLAWLPVRENDHFQILYTHSVHLSDVFEEYELRDGKLRPFQLTYEDTAVGMPANAGAGESFEIKNGNYIIKDLKGAYQELNLTIGQIKANHRIVYQKKIYTLKNYFGAGKAILIKYEKLSNWHLWKGEKLT
ncbi:DUF1850 domain-containing protein [Sporolactobacillus sp. THM7-7]|nr:DUF1850 domain-containing protein [Sporolactobacillus sp. THM7-7]